MLGEGHLIAFVACRDLGDADRFYGGTLGLRLIERSEFANVYDAGGTELRVTRVGEVTVAPYTVLGWRVGDIVAAINELREAGVVFSRYEGLPQDADGVWKAPGGSQIAWFMDPDGNTLSLQQPPATG